MQQCDSITADAPASHLTLQEIHRLARLADAQVFELGAMVRVMRGSFSRDFHATDCGLFRAAPIRSWLGLGA